MKYFLILTVFLTVFFNSRAQNYSPEIREMIAKMESPNTSDTQKMYLGNQIAALFLICPGEALAEIQHLQDAVQHGFLL